MIRSCIFYREELRNFYCIFGFQRPVLENADLSYTAFDTELIDDKQFTDLKRKVESLSIGLYKFISTIKQSEFKGQKYVSRNFFTFESAAVETFKLL